MLGKNWVAVFDFPRPVLDCYKKKINMTFAEVLVWTGC